MPKRAQAQIKMRFILSALGVFFLVLLIWFHGRPSDARLAREFKKNQSAFVELLSMVATNSQAALVQTNTNVWPLEQYRHYQTLLRQTGVSRAFQDGDTFHFQVAGSEKSGKGYRVTVTWTEHAPDHLIANLDEFLRTSPPLDHAYRPLGDGWYLCISR
jgi:hypothetical protein